MQIHNNFSFDFLFPLPPSDAPLTRSGVYKIYKDDTLVLTHTNTGVFGELALLYNQPRWEKYFEYQINQLYKIYTDIHVYVSQQKVCSTYLINLWLAYRVFSVNLLFDTCQFDTIFLLSWRNSEIA